MRVPRSGGHKALRRVVSTRIVTYQITRPDEASVGRFGESIDTSTATHSADLWLFEPNEINIDTEYGDRLGGDMQGLAMPSANMEVHDRLTHGAETYSVNRLMHIPDNDNQVLKMFSLERQTNEGT